MDTLHLIPVGDDRFGRPCYIDTKGDAYVDTDYQRSPRKGGLCTKYPHHDWYGGEPDIPLGKDADVVFADDLAEAANEALGRMGRPCRFLLKDGRIFRDNDEIPPARGIHHMRAILFLEKNAPAEAFRW